ncbi:MAG: hypothetical protein HOP29_04795 [Phycisphaerales bacterium]|nr:hypothetical protein [Phycisphaerales bacterium]
MFGQSGVRRHGSSMMLAAAAALPGGCVTVAGDWVADRGARTPSGTSVSAISFDQHGRYAVTESNDEVTSTTTGRYGWNGIALTLTSDEGEVQKITCRTDWDGSLVLRYVAAADTAVIRLRRRE